MNIGIIGAGVIGKTLAEKLSRAGHQVFIANSRSPKTIDFADNESIKAVLLEDIVKAVDVIILSIPLGQVGNLPKNLFDSLDRNIPIIETMNYFPHRDGIIEDLEKGKTHSVWVQEQIGRPVVKTFSNIVAHSFAFAGLPKGTPNRIALTISGDNTDWIEITSKLVEDTGFDPHYAGPIAESWRQQPVTPAYCADLTAQELEIALLKADQQQAIINRDIMMERVMELGEEHYAMVISGNYPDDYIDVTININRELNGMPLKA